MNETDRDDEVLQDEPKLRAPANVIESITANLRPQPAIPAMIVLLLTIILPVMSYDPAAPADGGSMLALLIPVGILASCGLAIAAGCCSFFPQLAWILVAWWAMKFTADGPLPAYNRYVLMIGMAAAAVMIAVQAWRVRTGRFVPTIRVDS